MTGSLTFITGPMYAGKSSKLLEMANKTNNKLLIKPAMDTRYDAEQGARFIVTHDDKKIEAHAIVSANMLFNLVHDKIATTIFFDEIQFFIKPYYSGHIVKNIKRLLVQNFNVVVNGLDMDYKGNPFMVSAQLMAMSDTVLKLKARCVDCGKPASKTFKKVSSSKRIELGSSNIYSAKCNKHWFVV